ncbi:MAG: nucleoside triphosphate pyrophosphohydrolase, partial [Nitriliruptorales bacterium]
MPRIVLVGASAQLPGLFPFDAWQALTSAEVVWAREPDQHPSAGYLELADVAVRPLGGDGGSVVGVDLLGAAPPAEQALARALVDRAAEDGAAVYLLGPADDESFVRSVGLAAARAGTDVEFVFHLSPPGLELLRLVDVERHLLDPDHGCPWDLEQDHASLARYLVEETYELLEAIEHGDDHDIAEELGDVLLQVVFHAEMATKRRAFTIDDVARGIADKLVHRHPHVFADVDVADAAEVKANWEVLKQQEKGRSGAFEGVPGALPALQLVDKLQRRAAKLGFDWEDASGPAARVREELDELTS